MTTSASANVMPDALASSDSTKHSAAITKNPERALVNARASETNAATKSSKEAPTPQGAKEKRSHSPVGSSVLTSRETAPATDAPTVARTAPRLGTLPSIESRHSSHAKRLATSSAPYRTSRRSVTHATDSTRSGWSANNPAATHATATPPSRRRASAKTPQAVMECNTTFVR